MGKVTKFQKKDYSEKRGDGDRVPIQLLVDYKADGSYLFDFCRDIGRGGVFIETEMPKKKGTDIDLTFTIPDTKDTITTKGKVIWVQPVVEGQPEIIPGMGIKFIGFEEERYLLLEAFVKRYTLQKMSA